MQKLAAKLKSFTQMTTMSEADQFLIDTLQTHGTENFTYNYYPQNYEQTRKCLHTICTQETVDWSNHYVQNKYEAIDPIFIKLKNSQLPIGWSVLDEIKQHQKNQKSVLQAAYDFGFQGGFGIPIHTPNRGYANLVIQEVDVLNKIQRKPNLYHELQVVAYHYHAKINDLLLARDMTKYPRLTSREIEILRLSANHQSAKMIGRLLKISPRTVSFHIENAMHKLSAKSKYEAIAILNSLGIL